MLTTTSHGKRIPACIFAKPQTKFVSSKALKLAMHGLAKKRAPQDALHKSSHSDANLATPTPHLGGSAARSTDAARAGLIAARGDMASSPIAWRAAGAASRQDGAGSRERGARRTTDPGKE